MISAEALVPAKGAGITREILFGAELGGVDKNGCDDRALVSGNRAGVFEKRGVPLVQCAHGWDKDAGSWCEQA